MMTLKGNWRQQNFVRTPKWVMKSCSEPGCEVLYPANIAGHHSKYCEDCRKKRRKVYYQKYYRNGGVK